MSKQALQYNHDGLEKMATSSPNQILHRRASFVCPTHSSLISGFLLLLSFLIFIVQANAQILNNQFFGSTTGSDLLPGHLVALDDGGAVITGRSNVLDTGGYHVLLIRADSLGQQQWQKTYHQGNGDWIAQTSDGGFVVGGSSERHPFGPDKGFVLKVNAEGEEEWNQFFPMGNHSFVSEVVPLSSSNIALCGVVFEGGNNASRKAFWAVLSADGNLLEYQTMDGFELSHTPSIVEAKGGNLIMAWQTFGNDILRCFSINGQTIWEINLTNNLDYQLSSSRKSLLVDALGDIWLAGGYPVFNLGSVANKPQVLHLSSNGVLKHRIVHEPWRNIRATGLFPTPNGGIRCRFVDSQNGNFTTLTWNHEGVLISSDTFALDSLFRTNLTITENHENRILILHQNSFYQRENGLSVQPITQTGTTYQALPTWYFRSGLPYSHEYYDAHCMSWSGGEFVLTRRGSPTGQQTSQLSHYVLKTNDKSAEIAWTYLGDASSGFGQIKPTTDGGALVLSGKTAYKLDANAHVIWSKSVKYGGLIAGPNNDFFIVESLTQPGIYDPIHIYHFNNVGDSLSVTNVYSRSTPYYLAGVVSQVENGPLLFANKYDAAAGTWRNWLIYLDKEGKFVSEILLGSEYVFSSFSNQIIQTTDGGTLIASHHYSTQGIHLMYVKSGQVLWEQSLLNSNPDSIRVTLRSIEEVPCKGFVLATSTIPFGSNTASDEIVILQHIDEHGQVKKFYSYKPLIGQLNPDEFLPGYTFHLWSHQFNVQTFDILRQSLHFQDSTQMMGKPDALAILPNPSSNLVCLRYESPSFGLLNIDIFNESGQCLESFKRPKTDRVWEMTYHANFPAGLYFVRIRMGGKNAVVQRWVKAN